MVNDALPSLPSPSTSVYANVPPKSGSAVVNDPTSVSGGRPSSTVSPVEKDFRRLLVDVGDVERQRLLEIQPALVGRADANMEAILRLIVERCRRSEHRAEQRQRAIVLAAFAVDQRKGERASRVRVGRAEKSCEAARRLILQDRHARNRDVGRRLVDVGDVDDKHLLRRESALVGRADADAQAAAGLVVERAGRSQPVAGDGERAVVVAAGAVDQRVGERAGRVRVGRRQEPDQRAWRRGLGERRVATRATSVGDSLTSPTLIIRPVSLTSPPSEVDRTRMM